MKKLLSIIVLTLCVLLAQAQDVPYFTRIVKELSSAKYQGRAYAQNGVVKAGNYLAQEFQKAGADTVFQQPFTQDINTYPGDMLMRVDGRPLAAGTDFVMREYSPGVHGTYNLYFVDTLNYDIERIIADLNKPENKGAMVVCDFRFPYKHGGDFRRLEGDETANAGFIYTWTTPLKFYKAYGQRVVEKPVIWTTSAAMEGAKNVTLDIDHQFMANYESSNIVARVQGRRHDSCFVFTAHYDHLGNLGADIYCPGVNDNASGTAAIVTLADYYAHHQPEFDIWFVAFAGEETGLCGSIHFTKNPAMPLSQIKYLFNLDMIGDNNPVQYCEVSEPGMAGFHELERINAEQQLFKGLNLGELAGNSDHYPFAELGVPCILFEQEEGDFFQYYHTPQDNMEHFCTVTYPLVFKLLTKYIEESTASLPVNFNEGVDLMSMVWRLMGDRTYNYSTVPDYCKTADDYFTPFKNHPVVEKAREYSESGIGYDAVASYGLHLVISSDGKISFNEQFAKNGDTSFDRWTEQQKEEFLPLLEDFYRESKFHQWYLSTAPVQREAKQAFAKVASQLDMNWFDTFFGPRPENSQFQIVLSILCGVNNYGCSATMKNGGERLSPVISCCQVDNDGKLFYNADIVIPIIVHEFCHAYCNPLNAQHWNGMEKAATSVFNLNKEKLSAMAYPTSKIMMDETFVRSCVIRYQLSHGSSTNKNKLMEEPMGMGFLLTKDLVDVLETYEQQRDQYAKMNDFMPIYVKIVNKYPYKKIAKEQAKAAKNNATYTCNIQDGATNIPSGEFNLVITFSKPIEPGVALGYGRGNGQFITPAHGKESIGWDKSQTILTISILLEPHTKYSFSILGDHYTTLDGHTAGETMDVDFTTGD